MTRTQAFLFVTVLAWLTVIFVLLMTRSHHLNMEGGETGAGIGMGEKRLVTLNAHLLKGSAAEQPPIEDHQQTVVKSSNHGGHIGKTTAVTPANDDLVREIDNLLGTTTTVSTAKKPEPPARSHVLSGLSGSRSVPGGGSLTTPKVQTPPSSSKKSSSDLNANSARQYEHAMSWLDFASTPVPPLHRTSELSSHIDIQPLTKPKDINLCSNNIISALQDRLSQEQMDWCRWALSPNGGKVVVGKSYGVLGKGDRDKYEQYSCNNVMKGLNPSCDDVWGDQAILQWRKNIIPDLCGSSDQFSSKAICRDSPNEARFCVFENMLLDFTKMQNVKRGGRSDSRKWSPGFLSTHCSAESGKKIDYYEMYSPQVSPGHTQCTHFINETVLVYGHDDIKNLGHSMSDFMNVWTMLWLSGLADYSHEITFLNTDAIRMGHNYYDELGQFRKHYELQFGKILKASDFPSDAQVCVKRLIFMPRPVMLYTWDGWWQDMRCSFVGPSSLFQRWNIQVRNNYNLLHSSDESKLPSGLFDTSSSSTNKLRVLLIKRTVGSNSASMYTSRVIVNIDDIYDTLKRDLSSQIDIVMVDLGKLTMEQQVTLIANVGLVIGVHGAGIPNAMHMSIGSNKHGPCCGVIEIFPQGEFMPIRGYGNMARRLGLHYQRMELTSSQSMSTGANIPPSALKNMVQDMVKKIVDKPTCVLPSVFDDPYFDSVPSGVL